VFFKLLNLAGIDINAEIAELRADFELKAQRVSERAAVKARNLAHCGPFCRCQYLFAFGLSCWLGRAIPLGRVALRALHRTGPGCLGSIDPCRTIRLALSYMPSSSDEPVLTSDAFTSPPRHTQSAPSAGPSTTTEGVAFASSYQAAPIKGEDLVEPLLVLLGPYLRRPVTGHSAIDSFIDKIAIKAEGTTNEAVERAADLVRNGNRATMWSVLGTVTLLGWLIARGAQPSHSGRSQA
jgi:hypothetical protein